jgi:Dyp-type peroxidase family
MATIATPALHTITVPISAADKTFKARLQDLQGNILKSHGRNHAAHVFLRFKAGEASKVKTWIKKASAAGRFINAFKQLEDTELHKRTGQDGGSFQVIFLAAEGYTYLGKDLAGFDATFKAGLRGSIGKLADPPETEWDAELKHHFHAMILIADRHQANVRFLAQELEIELRDFADAQIVFGDQQRNARDDGIEHFGYVDGRSQPLLLTEQVAAESDGVTLWDPAAGLDLALVPDPLGKPGASGSYFVFRKLEEFVKAFKTREQTLADTLGFIGDRRELAGALVIGRFEDGTPVTLSDEPAIESSAPPNEGMAPNNFDYRADLDGGKCPFQAHIRKSNPRGSGPGGLPNQNSRRMVRRGITYGSRKDDFSKIADMPEGGVGLLFMAYQKSIANQFEFIQQSWVNNVGFPTPGTGIDPVLGQSAAAPPAQKWPNVWGQAASTVDFDFRDFVKMRGGEYFFAPSLSSLGRL